ncbi:hypothetical protein PR202_gb26859 [Eleusine coracana subsp. coracana]|uniref:Spindle pole body-associated protein Vik1/Cik1 microtubule binding domain-containing protein n=1 Tax=Eleusine coracana subsp. coracana TaxID=191504 RepID=A0AAV5FSL2_ELECO|nr:hypothetical protein PR202_gb26859 [Eleusine coracana subsp. coracana]
MQSLPDTLSSLMGFNKYLTPTWVESVSHIIKELSPAKSNMEVMVQKPQHYGPDDTEPEAKVAMIQDEIDSLNAKLKQITLQRRQSLNTYLDLKGNIRVFCRVRPFHYEDSYQSRTLFTLDESNVSLKVAETKIKQYKFDKVFNQCATQGPDGGIEIENLVAVCVNSFQEVKRLYEVGTLLRSTASTMANSTSSRSHCEELRTEISKNTRNSKNYRDISKLPRFMKPTASSQHKIGLNKHVPASNRTKPSVPPKANRRPSSVYAESIRLPVNTSTWQSECNSDCSISMTSDMNWLPSMQDDTECSLDTSECETKQVILSEHENVSQDEVISVTECQHAEPVKVQNKTEEMGIIDIESWIHQQIIENTGIYQSIRVLHIPEVTEHGTYNSSTTSSLHMEWTKEFKWGQNEESGMNLSSPTHNIEDIKQIKAANQITTTELCTPPSEELSRNTERKEHKTERLAYHGSYRRSLKEIMENCIPKQLDKEAKADPSIQPEIRFQDKEDYIGNLAKFFRALRTTWIGALLGMGTMSLGLEEDFFQSLML